MSSVVLKLTSLLVKTLSKPIANRIKAQAREHERFRRVCVRFAQGIHRVDMRLRLGLLQDPDLIEKQIAREAAEAQARKHKLEAPTVRTEADQKAYEQETVEEKKRIKEKTKPRIRPLSEAKAIDIGATFVSESFLFLVASGLILFEVVRRDRKETTRRDDLADRIGELEDGLKSSRGANLSLEKEVLRLRAKAGEPKPATGRILPEDFWDIEQKEDENERPRKGWLSWLPRFGSKQVSPEQAQTQRAETAATTPSTALPTTQPPPQPKSRQVASEAQASATSKDENV